MCNFFKISLPFKMPLSLVQSEKAFDPWKNFKCRNLRKKSFQDTAKYAEIYTIGVNAETNFFAWPTWIYIDGGTSIFTQNEANKCLSYIGNISKICPNFFFIDILAHAVLKF